MFLIIISVILTLITMGLLGCDLEEKEIKYKNSWGEEKIATRDAVKFKFRAKMLFGLVWLLLILFGCFTKIPANSVGIEYNPVKGGIQKETLGEGYKLKSPFTNVYKISNKVTKLQLENISVQTKDSQYVTAILQAQVNIDKAQASTYFAKYGDEKLTDIQEVIVATIQKQLESVTTKYNVIEVLGEERDNIVNATYTLAYEELYKDGIVLNRLTLVDTDAGDTIEKAIQNEAVAKKEVETAEYKKQKAEIEGEAKVIEAKKQKEANDLLSKSLTDEILTEMFIEKWNGELPKVASDDNILDITGLIK